MERASPAFMMPGQGTGSEGDESANGVTSGRAGALGELPPARVHSKRGRKPTMDMEKADSTSGEAAASEEPQPARRQMRRQLTIDLRKEITDVQARVAQVLSPTNAWVSLDRDVSPKNRIQSPGAEFMDDAEEQSNFWYAVVRRGFVLMVVFVLMPALARQLVLSPQFRCLLILLCVLILSITETMPLYCVALSIPMLGSLAAVFGDFRTQVSTSTMLLSSFFNQTSFLVMGSLVVNSVFSKCGILDRMMAALLKRWRLESKEFLLVMMASTALSCSVLCNASIVVLAALKPLLTAQGRQQVSVPVAKRLLLGVAFSSNIGSVLLPISSLVNLITVSLLREFDHKLSLLSWVVTALPIAVLATLACWANLMWLYSEPNDLQSQESGDPAGGFSCICREPEHTDLEQKYEVQLDDDMKDFEMSGFQQVILGATCMLLLGITLFSETLEPIVGHPAILAVGIVVLVFGSGFMSREEFLTLEWDLLAITGGTNVMATIIRETALAALGSKVLSQSGVFEMLPFWPLLALVIVILVPLGALISHSLSGVVLLPLLVALGVKLKAAELVATLCALAIPFGMGTNNASFDNVASDTISRSLGRKKVALTQRDFFFAGNFMAMVGPFLVLTVGFGIGYLQHGLPQPPKTVVRERTPEELEPRVAKENRVADLLEVSSSPAHRSLVQRVAQGVQAFGRPRRVDRKRLLPGPTAEEHQLQLEPSS
eukprot:TRINITY_DN4027_c0_g1_i1.p1 TRINITY_DN4027_c0_g1~~TRINITY_DN4027_c0_g1_i1.p1  ORF type:complete len:716 (+),score=117.70 TRINITY_DN4027_c0_g1_i1:57-2204(+)